jgi:hypothetical protein
MANLNLPQCRKCIGQYICRDEVNPNGFSCNKFAQLVEEKFTSTNSAILKLLCDIKSIATTNNYLQVDALSICDKVDAIIAQLQQ